MTSQGHVAIWSRIERDLLSLWNFLSFQDVSMTLQLSMRAVASAEMQVVREYDCFQLSLWVCSSIRFPLGTQYNSFLLYLLQNMEDSCFLMKTTSLKKLCHSLLMYQLWEAVDIFGGQHQLHLPRYYWFAWNKRLLPRNWECFFLLILSHASCLKFLTQSRVHCSQLKGGSSFLKGWFTTMIKHFHHTVGSTLILSLDEHASLLPKV